MIIDSSYDTRELVSQNFHYKSPTVAFLTDFLHSLREQVTNPSILEEMKDSTARKYQNTLQDPTL